MPSIRIYLRATCAEPDDAEGSTAEAIGQSTSVLLLLSSGCFLDAGFLADLQAVVAAGTPFHVLIDPDAYDSPFASASEAQAELLMRPRGGEVWRSE